MKGKPSPWLTSELKKKMNERDKYLRKCRDTKCELTFHHTKENETK